MTLRWRAAFTFLAISLVSFDASARESARVLRVLLDSETAEISPKLGKTPWAFNEVVCVYRDNMEIGCGNIVKLLANGEARVKFTLLDQRLHEGDPVEAKVDHIDANIEVPVSNDPDLNPKIPSNVHLMRHKFQQFGVGVDLGTSHMFAHAAYNIRIMRDATFGIRAMNWLVTPPGLDSMKGFGGMATLSSFYRRAFQGFWGQIGVGAYQFSLTAGPQADSSVVGTGLAHVGYMGVIEDVLTMEFGVTGSFVDKPRSAIAFNFTTFSLAVGFELGLRL